MPALNFQKRFAPLVEDGSKRTTIRLWRKRPFKVGDRLYLYTGQRTKSCRKLGEAVCTDAGQIRIDDSGLVLWLKPVSGERLTPLDSPPEAALTQVIAQGDGFVDFNDMKKWFRHTHGLPFEGQIVFWDTPDAA